MVGQLASVSEFAVSQVQCTCVKPCALHVGVDAAPRQIISKRYRVVREPFTAPPVQQTSTNTQPSRRRRHRVQFAGTLLLISYLQAHYTQQKVEFPAPNAQAAEGSAPPHVRGFVS